MLQYLQAEFKANLGITMNLKIPACLTKSVTGSFT